MIEQYVNKLMNDVPLLNEDPIKMDLILDGGVFNGSYLFGGLYFLKELEKRNHIQVENISCCSIGSICALLYFIDALDIVEELYNIIIISFKDKYQLNDAFDITIDKIKTRLPEDICHKINNRLYISYHDTKHYKKVVKHNYKNVDELFITIRKSCFVPFMVDGNMLFKGKYYDGINPYIFPHCSHKKILHMNLVSFDKIQHIFCIKNEKTNTHRLLAGLLDVHLFFIKQSSTQMCSFIRPYSFIDYFYYHVLRYSIEKLILLLMVFFQFIHKYIPDCFTSPDYLLYKLWTKIFQDVYVVLLENVCL
jgi:hypothetical protein